MKPVLLACALAAAAALAQTAQANEKLAQASGCMTCHALDRKLIGPSYKEVAEKYRNDKQADAKLFQKVKAGGKGAWGETPMPPNPHVKDDDIKTLVRWVLTQK
jgi:cytochrome c